MKKPFILLWGLIAGVFLFCWIYLPALSKYQDLKVRQEGMDLQIKELEEKIAEVQEERNLLKNDVAYLEKTIRDELGLVKPGEIVYKFVPESPDDASSSNVPVGDPAAQKMETVVKPGGPKVVTLVPPKTTQPTAVATEPVYPRRETR